MYDCDRGGVDERKRKGKVLVARQFVNLVVATGVVVGEVVK